MLLLLIFFVVLIICLVLVYNLGKTYSVPNSTDFDPIKNKPNDNYILYGDDYILPYQYLDFTIPSHRWMYFYYPSYYNDYYEYTWPFPTTNWTGSRYSNKYHRHHRNDRKYAVTGTTHHIKSAPKPNVTRKTPRYNPHKKN